MISAGVVTVARTDLSITRSTADRGFVHAVGEEPGIAGGNRTILAATRSGRAQLANG